MKWTDAPATCRLALSSQSYPTLQDPPPPPFPLQQYVESHSITRIGWLDKTREEEEGHKQYAYRCARDYQRRHRQLIEIAALSPHASDFFETNVDFVSWDSLRTVPAHMYSDAAVRAIKASGTQWARSYGATLLIGDRVPVSFAKLGTIIGAEALRFTTLSLEQATFNDKVRLSLAAAQPVAV